MRRPVVVTATVVLVYVSALAAVVVGVLVLLSRYDVQRAAVLPTSLLGAAVILFGLLLIAMASGLARGSALSRVLATVYLGILALLHVATIVTTDGWDWSAIVQLVLAALMVAAMWTPPGSRYFAKDSGPAA